MGAGVGCEISSQVSSAQRQSLVILLVEKTVPEYKGRRNTDKLSVRTPTSALSAPLRDHSYTAVPKRLLDYNTTVPKHVLLFLVWETEQSSRPSRTRCIHSFHSPSDSTATHPCTFCDGDEGATARLHHIVIG